SRAEDRLQPRRRDLSVPSPPLQPPLERDLERGGAWPGPRGRGARGSAALARRVRSPLLLRHAALRLASPPLSPRLDRPPTDHGRDRLPIHGARGAGRSDAPHPRAAAGRTRGHRLEQLLPLPRNQAAGRPGGLAGEIAMLKVTRDLMLPTAITGSY